MGSFPETLIDPSEQMTVIGGAAIKREFSSVVVLS